MTKKSAFTRILIFLGVLVLPSIIWLLASIFGLKNKLDVNLDEKREKHKISSDMTLKTLPAELEAYYNDRVPFRSIIIKINNKINTSMENKYMESIEPIFLAWADKGNKTDNKEPEKIIEIETTESETKVEKPTKEAETEHMHEWILKEKVESDYETYGYEYYECASCDESKKDIFEKLVDTSLFPLRLAADQVIFGRNNWLFYYQTLSDYRGGNLMSEADIAAHVKPMIELDELCKSLDKDLYYIFVPNKNSVYPEYMPTVDYVPEKRRIELIADYIKNNTNLKCEYVLDDMIKSKPYHQLYMKYDTHWNQYGGAIVANAFYKMLGIEPIDIEKYVVNDNPQRLGDLFSIGGIDPSSYDTDNIYDIYYKPDVTTSADGISDVSYAFYESDADVDKEVTVYGDSYRFNFSKYLIRDFTKVNVIDRVTTGQPNTVNALKKSDIIVVLLVERNEYRITEDVKNIYTMLTQ